MRRRQVPGRMLRGLVDVRSQPNRGFNPLHQGGKVEVGRRVVRGIAAQDDQSLNPAPALIA